MQWYYANDGQRQGPVSQEDFERLVRDGVIRENTLVWTSGMPDWRPYASVAGSPAPADGPQVDADTAICAVSGKRYPKREMVQYEGKWISAEHRDEYFQRLREGVAQPGQFEYGGFGLRFVAKFIDGIVLFLAGLAVNMTVAAILFGTPNYFGRALMAVSAHQRLVFQAITIPSGMVLAIAYACFFISRWDATPGKMVMGLKIVRSDGAKLSIGRIVGRYFAEWVSGIILFIGYLMVIFDDERRALHDRICDTRVIKEK
jgi:uncharacterized RDD family membrane protein YckC